ncbi:hypothetical protein K1T71_000351 [Dendrolimus kikuchii]|uniref:Uncharacterized protein n=1 Tax=Dendrolimus kikuchii TaxID=765133 RepID=A0ACC1DJT2_9NEOP|nr:hypothetical protein K1T71_000351 [Dendrolimus kikuchii]
MLPGRPNSPWPESSCGIPRIALTNRYTAPVHIDVGGTIYTSSLETLTTYPDSKLAQMFNGNIPIVLDTLKQHYFIDRDGKMFQHILNFLRNKQLLLPDNFPYFDLLAREALYFGLDEMVSALIQLKNIREGLTPDHDETLSEEEDVLVIEQGPLHWP